ncbi:uncharacterized protein LOC111085788 [Limulus polyphemus]|uniref:Coiled-coil domain-containing protein 172 n=1 Tax=Limulus polyphemus TaxID=6850 RepID=A0ABM1SDK8_LIMPO|nr:uncharacterized protein LOC111085788 [Limulus polyphemus]
MTLSGQVFLKAQKLSEKEILLSWLKDKEAILTDQLTNLMERKKQAVEDMNCLIDESHSERRNFCKETKQFTVEYGTSECGKMMRKEKVKEELKILEQERLALQSELAGFHDCLHTIQSLRKETTIWTQELANLRNIHEG